MVPRISDSKLKDKVCYSPSTVESNVAHFDADLSFISFDDFECLLNPIDENEQGIKNIHEPISAVYKIDSDFNLYAPPILRFKCHCKIFRSIADGCQQDL